VRLGLQHQSLLVSLTQVYGGHQEGLAEATSGDVGYEVAAQGDLISNATAIFRYETEEPAIYFRRPSVWYKLPGAA
jgi:hypothetical protein